MMHRLTCCAIFLLSSLSSVDGVADVSASPSDDPAPSLGRRDWSILSRVQAPAAPLRWETVYPLRLTPSLATWLLPEGGPLRLRWDLNEWSALGHHYADDATLGLSAGLGLRNPLPTLLRYRGSDSGVSLTLAPGSPCTGACLNVAGSF